MDKQEEKVNKVKALVDHGATEGERAAARAALQRMGVTYVATPQEEVYIVVYKWKNKQERRILASLVLGLLNRKFAVSSTAKSITLPFTATQHRQLSSAYNYALTLYSKLVDEAAKAAILSTVHWYKNTPGG